MSLAFSIWQFRVGDPVSRFWNVYKFTAFPKRSPNDPSGVFGRYRETIGFQSVQKLGSIHWTPRFFDDLLATRDHLKRAAALMEPLLSLWRPSGSLGVCGLVDELAKEILGRLNLFQARVDGATSLPQLADLSGHKSIGLADSGSFLVFKFFKVHISVHSFRTVYQFSFLRW